METIQKILLVVLMAVLISCLYAFTAVQSQRERDPHQIMVKACQGKAPGDDCILTLSQNQSVEGVCIKGHSERTKLICLYKPSIVEACKDKNENDDCAYMDQGQTIIGNCSKAAFKEFRLMCNPAGLGKINEEKHEISPQLSISLPIYTKDNIYLKIYIPKKFKKLNSPISSLMEFIPSSDKDPRQWTEIITIKSFAGKKLKGKQIIQNLIRTLEKTAQDVKVLEVKHRAGEKYEQDEALIVYLHQSRLELLRMHVVSGVESTVIVQNTMLLKSDKDIEVGSLKLEQFFKHHVQITKSHR